MAGCGCGGSTRKQPARRDASKSTDARAGGGPGDRSGGYYWKGPKRKTTPKPEGEGE